MAKFAEVLVNKNKIYTYRISPQLEEKIVVGSEVEIPLRSIKTVGYVLKLVPIPEFPTKDILGLKRPERVFDESSVQLANWLSSYYHCYLATALKTILPKEK